MASVRRLVNAQALVRVGVLVFLERDRKREQTPPAPCPSVAADAESPLITVRMGE